jgi:hypothetical protein
MNAFKGLNYLLQALEVVVVPQGFSAYLPPTNLIAFDLIFYWV